MQAMLENQGNRVAHPIDPNKKQNRKNPYLLLYIIYCLEYYLAIEIERIAKAALARISFFYFIGFPICSTKDLSPPPEYAQYQEGAKTKIWRSQTPITTN